MKGMCANCGADAGLHHFETMQCPKNGIEETRIDRVTGKYYPQIWEETVFEDEGEKKLKDAAPELLEALKELTDIIQYELPISSDKKLFRIYKAHQVGLLAIKKATK